MKIILNSIYWFLIVIAVIQFIPIDRTNKPVDKAVNFVDVMQTPPNIAHILQKACYDCHSNETIYPGYAYVAPLSWSVKRHVNKGRNIMNFSVWKTYNSDLKKDILKKSVHAVQDFSMPLPAYIPQHPEANLTKAERLALTAYFEELLKSKNY